MKKIFGLWDSLINAIQPAGDWVALLPIRLLMAAEFGKAGFGKLEASGIPKWFAGAQENFLFPFSYMPLELNWFMVTWTEVIASICLFFGLFTRFWAFSLIIVTVVAIAGVHWPAEWDSLQELWKGYAISNKGFGNYRLPLLFIAMLIPLMFVGGGKLSLDHILRGQLGDRFR
jgi:putative oxidoreductase